MNSKKFTTITINHKTRKRLEKAKLVKGETIDNLLNRLLDAVAGSAKGENRSFKDTEKTAIDGITQVEAQ
ncbi:MAG: hypothetical protein JRN10_04750 [Nitrososphaerota archaeon]|jgi:hypothetical protein|nr:hypothetical protein [Nitrososphaerota archaeon]MDG6930533.1 hypothetical protein [Nitrososphaerota archaeon]